MKFVDKILLESKDLLNFSEVLNAIREYQSLSQKNSELIKLLNTNKNLIDEFQRYTYNSLKGLGYKDSINACRGQSDYFSNYYKEQMEPPKKDFPLNKITSFTEGNELASEFKNSPEKLIVDIPLDRIFYHWKVTEGLIKSEKEIIVLDAKLKLHRLVGDTDYNGKRFLQYVKGEII